MSSALKLIVGLGNPGAKYSRMRHNVGFWFVDALVAGHAEGFKVKDRFKAELCRLQTGEQTLLLCKPITFMNNSGTAVQTIASFYNIPPADLLLVHDELDLQPGIARLKKDGGHGGHNGLRDIFTKMGSTIFTRLRLGIGRPTEQGDATSYVLAQPRQTEQQLIDLAIRSSLDIMPLIFENNIAEAMNILHRKN